MKKNFVVAAALGLCIGFVVYINILSVKHTEVQREVMVNMGGKVSRAASSRDAYKKHSEKLQLELNAMEESMEEAAHEIEALRKVTDKYSVGTFQVTAYSPYDNVSGMENDGNPNKTSTGVKPREGTIAVDPKVIPYGSTIVIIYEDGSIETGRAEDCGGLIKGNIIDVFRQSYRETVKHGRKEATVIWYE